MSASQRCLAYAAFFAVVVGPFIAVGVGRIAQDNSPTLLTTAWVISALIGCLVAWKASDDEMLWRRPSKEDFRFTEDGWSILGWLTVFLLPPVGFVIGLILSGRENSKGPPMMLASLGILAVYAGLALLV